MPTTNNSQSLYDKKRLGAAIAYGVLNWLLFEATLTFTQDTAEYTAEGWGFVVRFGLIFAALIIPPYSAAYSILKNRSTALLHMACGIATLINISIIKDFWISDYVSDFDYASLYLGFVFTSIAIIALALLLRSLSKPAKQ